MTMPAIEPPLRPDFSSLACVLEVSAPEVELEPATVIVLTWPPDVVSLTMLPVVEVVVEEEVELVCNHKSVNQTSWRRYGYPGKYSGIFLRGCEGCTRRCTASGSLSQQIIRELFP
jgi:hypothetical protein